MIKKQYVVQCFALLTLLYSCNSIKYGELFEITDEFVDKLQTTYRSYGVLGGMDYTKYTKDKEFKVFLTFPDFTRHFFSSLADSVDAFVVVILNR